MSADQTAPTGQSQGPQQPRWAWWVVGIVLPLVGILITIMVSRPVSSDDKSDQNVQPAPLPAGDAAPTAAECTESLNTNAMYATEVKPGDRFCL